MRAAAVVAALSFALAPGKAQAWEHSWKPRRHHKRMTESRVKFDVKQFFEVTGLLKSRMFAFAFETQYTP